MWASRASSKGRSPARPATEPGRRNSSTRRPPSSRSSSGRAVWANALYQGVYPLSTALARPLIARTLTEVAREVGADAVAHGCTGKGNDQVRFDVAIQTLAPELAIIAPVREWNMNREDEIRYAKEHSLEIRATPKSPYSIDENLWGRSIEGGILEDPNRAAPEDVYAWTGHRDPGHRPPRRSSWGSSGAFRSPSTACGSSRSRSWAR